MKITGVILLLFLLLNFSALLAQEPDTIIKDKDMMDVPVFQKYKPSNNEVKRSKDNAQVSIEMGTNITSIAGNTLVSYYTMPSITYDISPKFDLTTGVLIGRSNYPYLTLNSNKEVDVEYSPLTDVVVFANGLYRYNSRLTITGGAYKNINDVPPRQKPYSSNIGNNNFQGMSLGINYSISENLHIGFEFNYSEGLGNYNMNPYNTINPFYNNLGYRYNPYFGF